MRLIKTTKQGTRVYRNAEWNEYVVKPAGSTNDMQWYYTDDKEDALATAEAMDAKESAMAVHMARVADDTVDLY